MPRKSAPQRLTHSAASRAFDDMESAHSDLEGTLGIFTKLIDCGRGDDIDVAVTIERHLKADIAAVEAAIGKAREVILKPLHALSAYDAPGPEEMPAGASAPVALVVDNGGGDNAA